MGWLRAHLLAYPLRNPTLPESSFRIKYVSFASLEITARLRASAGSQAEHAGGAPMSNPFTRSSDRTSHSEPCPLVLTCHGIQGRTKKRKTEPREYDVEKLFHPSFSTGTCLDAKVGVVVMVVVVVVGTLSYPNFLVLVTKTFVFYRANLLRSSCLSKRAYAKRLTRSASSPPNHSSQWSRISLTDLKR